MRSTAPMRIAKFGYIGVSVVMFVLGLCLICIREIPIPTVGAVCGSLLIVFGAIKLIGYFSGDLFRLAFQYDLASGILSVLVGSVLLIRTDTILSAFCTLFGIMALADGLFKIQITIEAKRFGIRQWWLILATAIVAGASGFALILFPGEETECSMMMFGIMLLADGLLNICTMITAVKIIGNQMPDKIEADFNENERRDR